MKIDTAELDLRPIHTSPAFPDYRPGDREVFLPHGTHDAETRSILGDSRVTAWRAARGGLVFYLR